MKTDLFIFCQRQNIFIKYLIIFKLITPTDAIAFKNPFTDEPEFFVQKCVSSKFVDKVLCPINDRLITKQGLEIAERCVKYGFLEEI